MKLVPTIGIEMHCEMKSNSKIFSPAANTFSKHSNNHVSPVDLGLPGILPSLNKECVRKGIMMALILNCDIPEYLYFDRKNYYYPDLPKGYQITQSHAPIGTNGQIIIPYEDKFIDVKIHDIHIEEDSARLEHLSKESLINYNRAGVPLLELVTEPSFHSKKEVLCFLDQIRKIYQYTDISLADVKKGQIRCDVNVSVSSTNKLGTKVEIKNVNSFSNIEKVLDIEIKRQEELIASGHQDDIVQETRRFDEKNMTTVRMRSKVDAIDYKYFVEPNIPKMKIDRDWVKEIKSEIPELPITKIMRYRELHLKEEDIKTITKERKIADYFDECIRLKCDPTLVANWLTDNILSYLKKEEKDISEISFTPTELSKILLNIQNKTISSKQAKEIFENVLKTGKSVDSFLANTKTQINDTDSLEQMIQKIIIEHPNEVKSYHEGRTNLFNFFVGLVMKETKGLANPVLTKEIITKALEKKK